MVMRSIESNLDAKPIIALFPSQADLNCELDLRLNK